MSETPLDKAKAAMEAAKDEESLGLVRQELLHIAAVQAAIDAAESLRGIRDILVKQSAATRAKPVRRA